MKKKKGFGGPEETLRQREVAKKPVLRFQKDSGKVHRLKVAGGGRSGRGSEGGGRDKKMEGGGEIVSRGPSARRGNRNNRRANLRRGHQARTY